MTEVIIYDPILKLDLLREYINGRIDGKYESKSSFVTFLESYRAWVFYGTPEYYRYAATHCFYCERAFDGDKYRKTLDHFYPVSRGTHKKYSQIFVVCCNHCNASKKKNYTPGKFSVMLNRANLEGRLINGFTKSDMVNIGKNVNRILNDVMVGVNQPVYWLRKPKTIPRGFIKVKKN